MTRVDYVIVWRSGGTHNFEWHRSLVMPRADAEATLAVVQRMGYRAYMERADRSIAIGLPETFGPEDPVSFH